MKLKYFTEQTSPRASRGGGSTPKVTFGAKGAITFNPAAAQLMGLKKGSKLSLAQDESDPENWYFFLDKEHGFEVRDVKGKTWLFQHTTLVRELKLSKELDLNGTIKGLIAGQPTILKGDKAETKYWGILIRPTV
jgi:hypothetical protein